MSNVYPPFVTAEAKRVRALIAKVEPLQGAISSQLRETLRWLELANRRLKVLVEMY
jgi:hypothetical protein